MQPVALQRIKSAYRKGEVAMTVTCLAVWRHLSERLANFLSSSLTKTVQGWHHSACGGQMIISIMMPFIANFPGLKMNCGHCSFNLCRIATRAESQLITFSLESGGLFILRSVKCVMEKENETDCIWPIGNWMTKWKMSTWQGRGRENLVLWVYFGAELLPTIWLSYSSVQF